MKKIKILTLLTAVVLSTQVYAGKKDHVVIQEAQKNHVQIAQAKQLPKDTSVTLTGVLVKQIDEETFELKDATGTMLLDIDDDITRATQIKVGDKVKVIGEVDTHKYKPTDIDVVLIEKINP